MYRRVTLPHNSDFNQPAAGRKSSASKIVSWIGLSRPPFHSVGVLPFLLGTFLAWRMEGAFNPTVFFLGVAGVILVMLSTYHAGEYFDYREDVISKKIFPSRFAGGSGIMPAGLLPGWVPLLTSIAAFIAAAIIGLVLQFHIGTGSLTMILGCLGAFPGFFYSTRPVRLVQRGVGELFIGFCYGWLPVASSFYIQTGYIHELINILSIPIGLTIFNVILLNEFPDHQADLKTGKKNILVRIGKTKGTVLYITVSVLSWVSMILSFRADIALKGLYLYIPVMAVSVFISAMMMLGRHRDKEILEMLCGLNIAVNLLTTGSYIFAFI